MIAYVSIHDFGTDEQKLGICRYINVVYPVTASVNDNGVVVLSCAVSEVGALLTSFAADPLLNWIEYCVQFDV